MAAFFKRCPSCGRRFGVRLTSKTLVNQDSGASDVQVTSAVGRGLRGPGSRPQAGDSVEPSPAGGLARGTRTIVTIDSVYHLAFRCEKCGHEWAEERVKTQRGRLPPNTSYGD